MSPKRASDPITLYIDTEFVLDQLKWLPRTAELVRNLLSTTEPQMLSLCPQSTNRMQSLVLEMAGSRAGGYSLELRLLSATAEFLRTILPACESQIYEAQRPNQNVERAKFLLNSDLARPWHVADLAKAVSVSPSHLTRLFSREVGVSPSKYLNEQRAKRMRHLIRQHGYHVSEAGRAVGWMDPSHASRGYSRVFGAPPTTN